MLRYRLRFYGEIDDISTSAYSELSDDNVHSAAQLELNIPVSRTTKGRLLTHDDLDISPRRVERLCPLAAEILAINGIDGVFVSKYSVAIVKATLVSRWDAILEEVIETINLYVHKQHSREHNIVLPERSFYPGYDAETRVKRRLQTLSKRRGQISDLAATLRAAEKMASTEETKVTLEINALSVRLLLASLEHSLHTSDRG